jgi:hypothetical protein
MVNKSFALPVESETESDPTHLLQLGSVALDVPAQPISLGLSAGPKTLPLVLRLAQQAGVGLVLSLGERVVPFRLDVPGGTGNFSGSGMGGVLGVPIQLLGLGTGVVGELVGSDFGVVAEFVGFGSGFGGDLLGLFTDFRGAARGWNKRQRFEMSIQGKNSTRTGRTHEERK